MATLFNMYQDTPQLDVSGTLTTLRGEQKARNEKNVQGSKDLLRNAAVSTIRKDYQKGISWDNGVKSADESFKAQYDRLMAVDPAAAAQLRQEYMAERTKRVNAEIADAYKKKASGVSGDIQALEQEIMRLEAEIQGEEFTRSTAVPAPVQEPAPEPKPEPEPEATPEYDPNGGIGLGELKMEETEDVVMTPVNQGPSAEDLSIIGSAGMEGYTPLATGGAAPTGLKAFYGAFPGQGPAAPQSALPAPRSGMQTQQESTEAPRMRGYRPLNAWYGGIK